MQKLFTLAASILATTAHAQAVTSLSPVANALAVPRTVPAAVTLAGTPAAGNTLRVFSSLVGGRKAGTSTASTTGLSFAPAVGYQAGETVTASYAAANGSSRVWQFTAAATGTGYFGGGSDLSFAAYPYGRTLLSIAAGDLTGDGKIDIVGRETGTNPSSLFTNNGSGKLSHYSYPLSATYDWQMIPPIGDLNGDGLLDLGWMINKGGGSFTSPTFSTTVYPSEYDGILLDVDGDGDLDYTFTSNKAVYTYTNTGTGALTAPSPGVAVEANGLLSAGDFDSDGDLDLVLYAPSNKATLTILRNNGQGQFTIAATYNTYLTSFYGNCMVAVGDVDGDGDLDLVVPDQLHLINSSYPSPSADVWLNNGQGSFTAPGFTSAPTSGIGAGHSVALGDVDGDGDLDVLVGGSTVSCYLNNGSGFFTLHYTAPNLSGNFSVILADMNNDGSLDIVAANIGNTPGGPGSGTPGVLSVRLNGYALATQPAQAADVQVWPNPVVRGGALRISQAPAGTKATIHNLLGERVASQQLTSLNSELSTAGLASGLYVLSLQSTGQLPLTYRIVVE